MCNTLILFSPSLLCQVYVAKVRLQCLILVKGSCISFKYLLTCVSHLSQDVCEEKQQSVFPVFPLLPLLPLLPFRPRGLPQLWVCTVCRRACRMYAYVHLVFKRVWVFVCVGGGGVFSPLIVCEIINPDPRRFTVRPTGKRNLIASGDHFFFL